MYPRRCLVPHAEQRLSGTASVLVVDQFNRQLDILEIGTESAVLADPCRAGSDPVLRLSERPAIINPTAQTAAAEPCPPLTRSHGSPPVMSGAATHHSPPLGRY